MFAYCLNNPATYCDTDGNSAAIADGGRGFSSGNMGAGYAGGGVSVTGIEEICTRILEGTAEIATWATTSSIYSYAKTFVDATADRYADHQPRVHHIIPRGKFRWYGPQVVEMMNKMHKILEDARIGINDPENLIIVSHGSHKSMHTRAYIIQIYNIMKTAENGERDAVLEALRKARQYVESLDQYKNGW